MHHRYFPTFTARERTGTLSRDEEQAEKDLTDDAERFLRLVRDDTPGSRGDVRTKVLIVDQDATSANALRDYLTVNRFDAAIEFRAEAVAPAASTFRPDIFIIDLLACHSSGIEIAGALRDAGFLDTPMVAICTLPAMLHVAGLYGHFHGYFQKPVDGDELVSRLRALTSL